MPSGTLSVAAAATSAAVTGSFLLPYHPTVTPAWNTTFYVPEATRLDNTFTVEFGTPVPSGGANLHWQVETTANIPSTPVSARLSDYLTAVRDLLHDPNADFWQDPILTRFINKAMQQRDLDAGGNRQTLTYVLTAGTAAYNFTTVGNPNVFDVVGITLLYGTQRIQLGGGQAYTRLTVDLRWSSTYRDTPQAFARYGPNQVVLAPIPSQAFTTEWDCLVYASPLVLTTDADPMPYPYTEPVPYYAARLAKINERAPDEAEYFLDQYDRALGTLGVMRTGSQPTYR